MKRNATTREIIPAFGRPKQLLNQRSDFARCLSGFEVSAPTYTAGRSSTEE